MDRPLPAAGQPAPSSGALQEDVDRHLGRYLEARAARPVTVAFSGGGDSLALLLAAKAWADGAGRTLLALTVDHRLRAESADWAAWCGARAGRLGVAHRILAWEGPKPTTGLSAAARHARHNLLADAARAAGAAVILMGHTADDRLEARAIRDEGGSVRDPRCWSPSPAWPRGRGLFLLRPLLARRRAEIRADLKTRAETWIEDPANSDPASPRARARVRLGAGRALAAEALKASPACLLEAVTEGPAGDLTISAETLARAPADAAYALLGAALLCASGGVRPPRAERLRRLLARMGAREAGVATLAGARVEFGDGLIRIMRDAGEFARRGRGVVEPPPNTPFVFDGRFELTALEPGVVIGPLRGRAARLSETDRRALRVAPAAARPALPAISFPDGSVRCALALGSAPGEGRPWTVRSLILPRLAAACGAVDNEASIRAW